jgi:nucleotide-binding universal stress UspA family protein
MITSGRCSDEFLMLDNIVLDPGLVRRVPPDLARQYHLLPVAEEDGHLTVAMADPDDPKAQGAIAATLGEMPYVVRSNQATIDALLAQVWPDRFADCMHVLVCSQGLDTVATVQTYAEHFGDLLGAHLNRFHIGQGPDATFDDLVTEAKSGHDLVILGRSNQSFLERLITGSVERRVVVHVPACVLLVQRPHWPLERILLILQGEDIDQDSADWAAHLARLSGAEFTALLTVPPVPAMYSGIRRLETRLPDVLLSKSALGQRLRRVAKRLEHRGISGTFKLQQGAPGWEMKREMAEGRYDLIVIGAEGQGWLERSLKESLVNLLLSVADCPVLVVKQTTQ